MRNFTVREVCRLTSFAVLSLALAMVSGCQDREVSMSILSVQPFDQETCDPVTDGLFQTSGTIDMAIRDTYVAILSVESNLIDVPQAKQFATTDARLSTNAILLRSATIEFSTLDQLSAQIPPKRNIPLSGTLAEGEQLLQFFASPPCLPTAWERGFPREERSAEQHFLFLPGRSGV